jgi:Trk K+ transport system NAD-binding subunit
MNNIVFLILRQMRRPLLTLVVAYAVAILGLSLIPGRDPDGNLWYMSIFHATYVISYVSTTIGFGEVPYEFTNAQRMWVILSIYATVISWIYAIGTILALLQDKTFQQALVERRFARRVKGQREPFFLVCGYGETGSALVEALTQRGQHAVVIDIDEARTTYIQLQNLREFVPSLHGDARKPEHLMAAGLDHPACAGVVALTNDNAANLKVAITAKLLHPERSVICRADSKDVEANMASFGTDYIIDPFDTFAAYLSTAMQMPCLYLLQRWLTGADDVELSDPLYPPREGHWIICGYGRFGKAVYARLKREGAKPVVIEATPERTGAPPEGVVQGWGTEADTLLAAGVDRAVGLVAGTHDDANNLSIVMTARDLNRDLFVIVRQNHRDNGEIVRAARADMVMHPSTIIAEKIRVLLATPYLYEFFKLAQYKDNAWACQVVSRIGSVVGNLAPAIRTLVIDAEDACALHNALSAGAGIVLGDLLRDPWDRERTLSVVPLLLARSADRVLLPEDDELLAPGDRLLVCGESAALTRIQWAMCHAQTLEYVRSGTTASHGWLWRRLGLDERAATD